MSYLHPLIQLTFFRMKHLLILVLVTLVTLTIVFIVYRPDLLEDIWLWLIGLVGPIVGLGKAIIQKITNLFNHNSTES